MSSTSAPSAAGPSTAPPAPSSSALLIDSSYYSTLRDQKFYIGHVLIPTESLKVDPSLQRPLDPDHAKDIMPMYSNDVDLRTHDPLECIVDIGDKDKVEQWIKEQDQSKLTTSLLEDMLVLDLSDTSYIIVKGQHRYRAYCQVMEEAKLPQDFPHPGCLAVNLYHSDPNDPKHHRLFGLAVRDNLPTVKKEADVHSLGQCVMRTSWAAISDALSQFHDLDFHHDLGRKMKAELHVIYQISQTPKAQSSNKTGASDRRFVAGWAACKIFLDHTLLEALIELNDNSFGQNFFITVASLEGLFHKVEWLPFLAMLFRDIFEVVKDFKTSEGDGRSKGLLNDLSKAYSSRRLHVDRWPKFDLKAWLQKAEEFQEHWFDFKRLSYNALIGTKKDFIIAADCFRVLAMLLSDDGHIWNKATVLDNDLKQKKAVKDATCHTHVHWNSCPEGVLRNYIYNKFVGPHVFGDNTHYCLIKDDKGVVQDKVSEVVSFIWSQRFTLKLPSQCKSDKPFCLLGVGSKLSATYSINPEPFKNFMVSLSEAVSSCTQWRHLLRDVLDCSSPLPCGIVADWEKLETPTPAPYCSPLSSCPSSPHRQTSPLPSTSRQKPATPELPSSPKPSSSSPATQKKARSYIGQIQHKTSTSAKVAPQQKQRKRRATPIFTSDEPEEDELEENKEPESEPESEPLQSDKEGNKSDKGEEEESEEGEEGEKASCQPKDIEEEEEEEDEEPEGEMEKKDASEDGGADEGGEKGKDKEACQQEGAREHMDEDEGEHAGGEEAEKVAYQQKDMSEGEGDKKGQEKGEEEEEEEAQQKEQVDEEEDKEPEGEMEKEDKSEDGGADEGGEKGKGKEACQQEGAREHMDEDEGEHAGGEEAEKGGKKICLGVRVIKKGEEKEVAKKRPVSTEEGGSSKRAKFDPPAPSAQQQTQGSYAGEATQEPIYSIDELKKAESPHCIPYMDWSMPEEDIREYLTSFINDKRIPAQTLFNLFQTSIKLYNVGGGSRKWGIWDHDPEAPKENLTIEHTFNGTDMMFDPEEIGGRTSATYPSEKEDVEMRDLDRSSPGGSEGGEEMGL
ncbi:hypothetical protein EDB83DRAFT_2527341 [Lactarius deliciosus]|nr:hypothetical protein EDB83DRAFT_2527341 [Lactarius deliciosus]